MRMARAVAGAVFLTVAVLAAFPSSLTARTELTSMRNSPTMLVGC